MIRSTSSSGWGMTMTPDPHEPGREAQSIYDVLAHTAPIRLETGMSQRMSDQEQEAIRKQFRAWMTEHGIARQRVYERLECSQTTGNQVLNGKYEADPTKYLLQLKAWMASPEAVKLLQTPAPLNVAELSCLVDIRNVVEHAVADNTCALIVGESGTCKTTFGKARAHSKTNCIYVDLDDDGYTRVRLLRKVADAIHLEYSRTWWSQSDRLMTEICERLKNPPRVMIFDNAHLLSIDNLWTLHAIHDRTGSTIVCMGLPLLLDKVNRSRHDRGIGATVYSRFAYKLDLSDSTQQRIDPLDPKRNFAPRRQFLHTVEDVAKFLAAQNVKVHKSAIGWLHSQINCPDSGGWHVAKALLRLASRCYLEKEGLPELRLEHLVQAKRVISPQIEQRQQMAEMERIQTAAAG